MTSEHGFPFVAFLDPDIVVSPTEIHLGEHLSSLQFLRQLLDKREQIIVLDCVFIEIAVILYHPFLSILFRDEEYGRGLGRFRWSDVAFLGLIVYEVGHFLCSCGNRGINLPFLDTKVSFMSIAWSHGLWTSMRSHSFFEKTLRYL